MRRPEQRDQGRGSTPLAAWLPVFAAMGIMITGCLSTFLVLQLDQFRPKVGDVVVFKPGSQDTDMWQMLIPATELSKSRERVLNCTLDPNVMAVAGGSLVVEARQENPNLQYQVHWAGARTAADASDCGTSADLIVSRTDLQRLANAAGGFGVGEKGVVR